MPALGLAVASAALLLLLLCTYWFLAGDHRVDRILLAGLPDPSGASGHQGYWSSTAWLFTALGSPEIVFVLASALVSFLLLAGRLDVPTRTSYVMAVVTPDERAAAASVTAVPRSLAAAASPVLAG